VLERAREAAREFLEEEGESVRYTTAVNYLEQHWQRRYGLAQVG
jgi:hypothetical protein